MNQPIEGTLVVDIDGTLCDIKAAGQSFDYASLPDAAHAMHAAQPERFATVVRDWAKKLKA